MYSAAAPVRPGPRPRSSPSPPLSRQPLDDGLSRPRDDLAARPPAPLALLEPRRRRPRLRSAPKRPQVRREAERRAISDHLLDQRPHPRRGRHRAPRSRGRSARRSSPHRIDRQTFSSIRYRCSYAGSGSPSSYMRANRAASATSARAARRHVRTSGSASQTRISTVPNDWCGRTSTRSRCARGSTASRAGSARTPRTRPSSRSASGIPQRGNIRVNTCDPGRAQVGVAVLEPRRAGGRRRQLGDDGAERVAHRDRAVGVADPDVDVDPERVVPPGHVAGAALDESVVRRVDDLLVLPRRERVRAVGASAYAELVGQRRTVEPAVRGSARRPRRTSRSAPS